VNSPVATVPPRSLVRTLPSLRTRVTASATRRAASNSYLNFKVSHESPEPPMAMGSERWIAMGTRLSRLKTAPRAGSRYRGMI